MRVGLQIMRFDWPHSSKDLSTQLAKIVTTADTAGFASIWVMDHFFQMGGIFGPEDDPMLEGYSAIAYIAALTQQAKLGVLVTGNLYRHPGILIKMVSTLDVLSQGRAYFGIGAGWYERESRGLGVPFPSMRERFESLEETLQIAKHMWSGNRNPYHGTYYQLAEPINVPAPLSIPHPPILIGGAGERKTLRLVAQYGDACNLYAGANLSDYRERFAILRHKLDVLRSHCEDVGRPCDDIERTVLGSIQLDSTGKTVPELLEVCRTLSEIGFQHIIFNMPNAQEITPIETLGRDVIPVLATY